MFATSRKLVLLAWTTAAAVTGCQTVSTSEFAANADPTAEIDTLIKARDAAAAQNVNTLAPNSWSEVNTQIDEAKRERDSGSDSQSILKHVALGKASLKKANESAQIARSTMPTVIEARRLAVEAKANDVMKQEFDVVEKDFKNATEEIEDGDLGTAERSRTDLEKRYADVELKAIKVNALSTSWKNIEQAEKEGAEEWAPRSLAQAKQEAKQAEELINTNRHDKAAIGAKAQAVTAASASLVEVTRQAKVAQKTDAESLVLARQEQERKAAADKAAAQQAAATATSELSSTQGAVAQLKTENTQLAAERAFNQKFAAAQGRFSPSEAEVMRQGNLLLIRLKGIDFASAKANIPPKNFGLLNKVIETAKDFSSAKVNVEGHTDADGSKAANLKLSDERAASVVEYIAANGIDRGTITAQGFGDTKPLATNKTKEGKAQNRRVDVIVTPGGDAATH